MIFSTSSAARRVKTVFQRRQKSCLSAGDYPAGGGHNGPQQYRSIGLRNKTMMQETDSATPLLAILEHCAKAAPNPWYPSLYARETNTARDTLDPHLERLRLGGLVEMTDWVQGANQGYRLTAAGQRALQDSRAVELLKKGRLPERSSEVTAPRVPSREREGTIAHVLLAPVPPVVTTLILVANTAVFLYGLTLAASDPQVGLRPFLTGFGNDDLWTIEHDIGAVTGSDIIHGQWWKLLTCCFVHFGLPHLAVNMYTLYAIGPFVEQIWGRWRYLLIYLVSGVGGSCAMVLVNPESRGAGASGALWGVMLAEITWVYLNRAYLPGPIDPKWVRNRLTVFLINLFISVLPYISAAAHFGGGAVGVAAAVLLNTQRFSTGVRRWLATFGMALLPLACVGAIAWQRGDDPRWLDLEYKALKGRVEAWTKSQQYNAARVSAGQLTDIADKYDPFQVYDEHLKDIIEGRRPERRKPEEVEKALKTATEEEQKLALVATAPAETSGYSLAAFAEADQATRELIAAAREYYRQAAQCLQAGDEWKQREKELAEQRREVERRLRHWKDCCTEAVRARDRRHARPNP